MDELPERHFECSECKKPVVVCYTEIVGKMMYKMSMCSDCPILRQKLYGQMAHLTKEEAQKAGLSCGGCGLTQDEIKMGSSIGCGLCYEVFEDLIIQELATGNRIPQKALGGKRVASLHVGRLPGQKAEVNPAIKLLALHQALHETIGREDYEQAAWLRDQIKALTEEGEGKGEGGKNKKNDR